MNIKDLKSRTKVLIVSAGILGTAGLGIGATKRRPAATQSATADTPTPSKVADAPGVATHEPARRRRSGLRIGRCSAGANGASQ